MLKKLQQKWNVGGKQFFLILCVFAITGTTTAWLTKVITTWMGFTAATFWLWKLLLRLGMLVIGYQIILLTVAFLFGQFAFFWEFEKRMLRWMGIGGRRSAVGNGQWAMGGQRAAIGDEAPNQKSTNQPSAISGRLWAMSNEQWAMGDGRSETRNQKSTNQQSAISNQQSAVSGQWSATGNEAPNQKSTNQPSAISGRLWAMSNEQWAIGDGRSAIGNEAPNQKSTNQQSAITHLALFASGAGSNAQKIINYFRDHPAIKVTLIASNKPQAGVLQIAQRENIASLIIERENFFRGDGYTGELKALDIHWIILAGFLWKVPLSLIQAFPGKIINIHPALLPKYGGKGMYGHFVHEAVIAAGEKESGITIHYVDEQFDHGQHILQATCPVEPGDTPDILAKKVQVLEHKHYPEIIEKLISEHDTQSLQSS